MINKEQPRAVARAVMQILLRDIGKYGGTKEGVNKYFHILNAIDNLQSHLIVNYGGKWFIEEFNRELKNFEGIIYSDLKDWTSLNNKFQKARPILAQIQMAYDYFNFKKSKSKGGEIKEMKYYLKLVGRVSPYQLEIFVAFQILMKMSGVQWHSIPKGYWKTPDTKDIKSPFDRSKEYGDVVKREED